MEQLIAMSQEGVLQRLKSVRASPRFIGAGTVWAVWVQLGRGPHRFLTVWAAHAFWPTRNFQLVELLRPELLTLNQCHAAKYSVCEYGAVICVGFSFLPRCIVCRAVFPMSVCPSVCLSVCLSVCQTREL